MEDYYSILGISKNSSQDDIKKAYRKLASKYHPDHGGDTAGFQQIQTAYEILGDPHKRQQYDNPAPFPKFFSDVFEFGKFDFFRQSVKQPSIRISLWLDIRDVYGLSKKIVSLNINSSYHSVEIDIPPGLEDGQAVRYQRLGNTGEDIVIVFRIRRDPVYIKDREHVILEQNCSIWTLICGGELEVQDPAGITISVTVPVKTRPGTRLRIRNRGFILANGDRGDLFVHINAVLPDKISPELLEHIQKEANLS